jgi:hypothetical protein
MLKLQKASAILEHLEPSAPIVLRVRHRLGGRPSLDEKWRIRTRFWARNIPFFLLAQRSSLGPVGMLNRGAALNFRELPAPPNSAAWAAAWRPYVEVCIELFGAERCNFESNFP